MISVGRGDVIDEDSLVQAIRRGWLSGGVLDVCEKEPLPADSQLWDMPEVLITPHVSGLAFGEQVNKLYSIEIAVALSFGVDACTIR